MDDSVRRGIPIAELITATDEDRRFLFEVYAATRADELAFIPWSDAQKSAFLRMQFQAQDRAYRDNYPNARFLLIIDDDRPVGRLYLDEREHEILVIDIALLPTARGRGIGSALLKDVLAQAAATHRAVTLHVTPRNPARRLYDRLGFVPTSETEMHIQMEWRANLVL